MPNLTISLRRRQGTSVPLRTNLTFDSILLRLLRKKKNLPLRFRIRLFLDRWWLQQHRDIPFPQICWSPPPKNKYVTVNKQTRQQATSEIFKTLLQTKCEWQKGPILNAVVWVFHRTKSTIYSSLQLWLETTTRAKRAPSPDNIASKFGQYKRVPRKFTTAKNFQTRW